jgi:hypothetical protein
MSGGDQALTQPGGAAKSGFNLLPQRFQNNSRQPYCSGLREARRRGDFGLPMMRIMNRLSGPL